MAHMGQEADMDPRTFRDKLHALGPLVLRVGIALVLLQDGLQRSVGIFEQDALPAVQAEEAAPADSLAVASPEGVRVNADWGTLLGVGEVATGGLLFIGLFTRLVALPVLALLGYGLFVGFPYPELPTNTTATPPRRQPDHQTSGPLGS